MCFTDKRTTQGSLENTSHGENPIFETKDSSGIIIQTRATLSVAAYARHIYFQLESAV